jgi:regulatory protein SWI6
VVISYPVSEFPYQVDRLLTISAITSLLSDTEKEFAAEMDAKQKIIDTIHKQLRESSAQLGEERRRLETLQKRAEKREQRKHKISNLRRAADEEHFRLGQLQRQHNQTVGSDGREMRLGDADKDLAVPAGILPDKVVANVTLHQGQPIHLEQAQLQKITGLPSTHILRARLNAYAANNEALSDAVKGLKGKSSDLEKKYRRVIALCTGVEDGKVDGVLASLFRAVNSEVGDVELTRVREFLRRVDSVE